MNREEFVADYGDVVVRLESYYKYIFTFGGTAEDGRRVVISVGDDAEDIYGLSLHVNADYVVKDFRPFSGRVYDGGVEVEGFFEYFPHIQLP